MTCRIPDLFYLYLTDIRLSDLATTQNPLSLCDDLLNENKRELLVNFTLLKQELFDVFNNIVRRNSHYVTTLGQVLEFVDVCVEEENGPTYAFSILAGDFSIETLQELPFPEDLIVIIEVED